jgi:hypothetical protein
VDSGSVSSAGGVDSVVSGASDVDPVVVVPPLPPHAATVTAIATNASSAIAKRRHAFTCPVTTNSLRCKPLCRHREAMATKY